MNANTTHGSTPRLVYLAWTEMKRRCRDPRRREYPRYGGRGIAICARWESFTAFRDDMGPRPDGASLDRIDNEGNYEPSNCRWAVPIVQANNRRNNIRLSFCGESLTLAEWSRRTGIPYGALHRRVRKHWSIERTLRKLTPRMTRSA